jgi:hypothetical protein
MMPAPEIETRHKVLIAAAATAALGENIRILEIRPVRLRGADDRLASSAIGKPKGRPTARRRMARRAITNHA